MKKLSNFEKTCGDDKNEYDACIDILFSLGRFGIKPGLEIMEHILHKLGNPEKNFKSIHIAGTNGKGSTASTLASIMSASGIKTGLFTSPHLIQFNERIRIDGVQISDNEVVETYERVKEADTGDRPATFFEYATAMAFLLFAEKNVEIAVIEAGMGGRLDSTNVITPCACVITNISMDHEVFLGNSILAIAKDKSGIIKKDIPVITGVRNMDALKVIEHECAEKYAILLRKGYEFDLVRRQDGFSLYMEKGKEIITDIEVGLKGDHQLENTSLAIAASRIIRDNRITEENIKSGIRKTIWPGRLETVHQNPEIILDGAHNPEAAERLASHIKKYYPDRPVCLIIGMMKDKDMSGTLAHLSSVSSKIITTESKSHRAAKAKELASIFYQEFHSAAIPMPDLPRAIEFAMAGSENNELICITGSLYIVGEAKAYFEGSDFQTAPN